METCQYKKCDKEATTKGFVLVRNPEGGEYIPTDVVTCEKHKKTRGFFEHSKS